MKHIFNRNVELIKTIIGNDVLKTQYFQKTSNWKEFCVYLFVFNTVRVFSCKKPINKSVIIQWMSLNIKLMLIFNAIRFTTAKICHLTKYERPCLVIVIIPLFS
jgi:hypothetical protein